MTTNTTNTPNLDGVRFQYNNVRVATKKHGTKDAVITAAYRVLSDKDKNLTIEAGYAFCSPFDMRPHPSRPSVQVKVGDRTFQLPSKPGSPGYSKQTGRTIAHNRLRKNPLMLTYRDTKISPEETVRNFVLNAIRNNLLIPGKPNSWSNIVFKPTTAPLHTPERERMDELPVIEVPPYAKKAPPHYMKR